MTADITRLYKGVKNDFEVEVVYTKLGDQSPKEPHPFEELILVLTGAVNLERSDMPGIQTLKPYDLAVLPPGTVHQMTPQSTPTRLLVIHPQMP